IAECSLTPEMMAATRWVTTVPAGTEYASVVTSWSRTLILSRHGTSHDDPCSSWDSRGDAGRNTPRGQVRSFTRTHGRSRIDDQSRSCPTSRSVTWKPPRIVALTLN